jgi:hypothetical protein
MKNINQKIMKKVLSTIILVTAVALLSSSFKSNKETYYAFAFVYSKDWKTIYYSSVFSFTDETNCTKIKDWAEEEFTDKVDGFDGGKNFTIRPQCTYNHPIKYSFEEVRKQRNDLIEADRYNGRYEVKLISFPSSN